MEAYRGPRGKAPLILNLNTRCRWLDNFMPHSLYGKEEPKYSMNRWLMGTRVGLGILRTEECLVPVQIWTLHCPARSLVTTLTMWHQSHWSLALTIFLSTLFRLIEQAGVTQRRACAAIFLDEWGTSGRKQPDLEYLLQQLGKAELFRAADYVADIIKGETKYSLWNCHCHCSTHKTTDC